MKLTGKIFLVLILILAVLRFLEVAAPRSAYSTVHFERGMRAEQQNEFLKAVKFYRKAVHYNPKNPLPYEGLGKIAKREGDIPQMVVYYQKAADAGSSNWEIYFEAGMFFFHQKDFSRASTFFVKAAELDRKNAQINFYSGLAYEAQEAYREAINSFQTAISNRYPAIEPVRYHLAICYYKIEDLIHTNGQIELLKTLENAKADNLLEDLHKVIGWQDPQFRYRLGAQLYQKGDIPGVKEQVANLIKMNETALAQKLQGLIDTPEAAFPQQVP